MATLTARMDVPLGEHAVRDAQAFTSAAARAWQPGASVETLVVLVDELADAVVDHAAGEHSLVLDLTLHPGAGLRVSVADGAGVRGAVHDVVERRSTLAALLTVFTRDWGHEPYQDGYRVWFELDPVDDAPADDVPVEPLGPADVAALRTAIA